MKLIYYLYPGWVSNQIRLNRISRTLAVARYWKEMKIVRTGLCLQNFYFVKIEPAFQ